MRPEYDPREIAKSFFHPVWLVTMILMFKAYYIGRHG